MHFTLHRMAQAVLLVSVASSAVAQTATVQDRQGNVGYATAEACDAAVQSGKASFYRPVTRQTPKRRAGETAVSGTTLAELGSQYALGACDMGAGHTQGRGGVSKALQGKWIAYSPSMKINAYKAKDGKVVRVTMQQCDNNFAAAFPRAVPAPAPKVAAPVAAPAPAPVPVVAAPAPAPAVAPAPVVVPKAAVVTAFPYVFGTLGAQRDLLGNAPILGVAQHDDHDSKLGLQAGAGYQFNPTWGAEAFIQGGGEHKYENTLESKVSALGLRATAGTNLTEATRVFGKLGVARVKHTVAGESASQTRPTLGLGVQHALNQNLAVRADFDHYLKKSADGATNWKALNYIGVGLQYSFK